MEIRCNNSSPGMNFPFQLGGNGSADLHEQRLDAYLAKPVDPAELAECLQRLTALKEL